MYEQEIEKVVNEHLNNRPIGWLLILKYGDNDFSNELHRQADSIVYNYVRGQTHYLSEKDKAIIIASLTMIAIEDYDANMWNHVSEKYVNSFKDVSLKNKSVVLIKNALESSPTYDPSLRYISVPLKQAAVPFYWLQRFFAFCQDIYEHNLLLRYLDDDFVKRKYFYIFQQLKTKHLLTNDDADTLIYLPTADGHNKKTYCLSGYTKQFINSNNSLDVLLEIARVCTKAINDNFVDIPFFKSAFEEWKNKNSQPLDEKR